MNSKGLIILLVLGGIFVESEALLGSLIGIGAKIAVSHIASRRRRGRRRRRWGDKENGERKSTGIYVLAYTLIDSRANKQKYVIL